MQTQGFSIRYANEGDCALILQFIQELAAYEKLAHEVVATEEILRRSLFEKRQAEVLIGEEQGKPVAFALYFHNFSTFLGKANLYLEDLFVKPACRGRGYGRAMLRRLSQIALERDCERLDWWCLDWNEQAVCFYQSIGAAAMDEWTVFRLQGETLKKMGK